MQFNFDEVIERRGTRSMKWDGVNELYGGENLHPMWVADMDFQAPPGVRKALAEKIEHGIFGYPQKIDTVYEAISDWVRKRFQWKVKNEQILLTSGVVPAINQLILAFTEPDDRIIIQTPVYFPFYKLVTNNGRQLVKNPLMFDGEHYKMDLDHLRSVIDKKTKMLILCSPHNPVGRVWTKEELTALAAICEEHNILVIADEIHADIVFAGHVHTPFATVSPYASEQTITCMAPSKTFNLAGLQGSYVIAENDKLKQQLQEQLIRNFLYSTNMFAPIAMEAAYRTGEPWLEALLHYLQGNIETAKEFLQHHLPQIELVEPEGTYLLWLNFSKLNMTAAERKKWLVREANVALSQGITFGEEGKDFERVNIGCPKSIMLEGLERIKASLPR